MPSNVEVKARVRDRQALLEVAKRLSSSQGTRLEQEDTFFPAQNGRLKLRIEKGSHGQLIFYNRNDTAGPKLSDYTKTIVQNPEDLKNTLSLALGVKGCVRKVRLLFMVGQTRIHIDTVEDLGDFMELEVCMKEGQSLSEGQEIAQSLLQQLGVSESDLISVAYVDLLAAKQSTN